MALWDLRNLKAKIHVMEHHKEEVYHLAWSPHHETILATAGSDRQVLVWDVARIGDDKPISGDSPPELLVSNNVPIYYIHSNHLDYSLYMQVILVVLLTLDGIQLNHGLWQVLTRTIHFTCGKW